jgi:hypothetical protein
MGLQPILTPRSSLKKFESDSSWNVGIPPYWFRQFMLHACSKNCLNAKIREWRTIVEYYIWIKFICSRTSNCQCQCQVNEHMMTKWCQWTYDGKMSCSNTITQKSAFNYENLIKLYVEKYRWSFLYFIQWIYNIKILR